MTRLSAVLVATVLVACTSARTGGASGPAPEGSSSAASKGAAAVPRGGDPSRNSNGTPKDFGPLPAGVRPTDDPRAFQFALTLSQNLKRNRQASGTVELRISGADGQRSTQLGLAELGGTGKTLDFSFKYFQQLAGLIMLPDGFKPTSVRLRVLPEGSGPVEREFMWKDVVIEGDA